MFLATRTIPYRQNRCAQNYVIIVSYMAILFQFYRGYFDAKVSTTESLNIFKALGSAFSKICETWLNDKDRPDGNLCKYWGIAFLCSKSPTKNSIQHTLFLFAVSLTIKIYSATSHPPLSDRLWEIHILNVIFVCVNACVTLFISYIQNHQKLYWEQDAFSEIKKGFECMRTLEISPARAFGPRHFTELLTKQQVIPFLSLR